MCGGAVSAFHPQLSSRHSFCRMECGNIALSCIFKCLVFWCDVSSSKVCSQFWMHVLICSYRDGGGCRTVCTYPSDYFVFHVSQLYMKWWTALLSLMSLHCSGKSNIVPILGCVREQDHVVLLMPFVKHERFSVSTAHLSDAVILPGTVLCCFDELLHTVMHRLVW